MCEIWAMHGRRGCGRGSAEAAHAVVAHVGTARCVRVWLRAQARGGSTVRASLDGALREVPGQRRADARMERTLRASSDVCADARGTRCVWVWLRAQARGGSTVRVNLANLQVFKYETAIAYCSKKLENEQTRSDQPIFKMPFRQTLK
jgi:hypothetical protein